ncbi:B12-binding domain-containing radical SAM protein [Roseofilum casamattae]|uniref:Radical SAM protein n=1 Tax=Roseofilum casamattae BLCC-M143 TaxID=3022442 RepID=A0ABT7BVZ4_9CYAN|nr:radical SAM protein [Roseofilum casamattae BLCC-M143]
MSIPLDRERLLFSPVSPETTAIPTIFAFPNTYSIGITSLGYQTIWSKLCQRSDVDVRRLFTDGSESLPREPELVGFSLSWELDYSNILMLLDRLQIPRRSRDRGNNHPLIFGGGPVLTANPEPFADFFDVILLGDGENLLDDFIDRYQQIRGTSREPCLIALAAGSGIYIPSLYQVSYANPTGEITAIRPRVDGIPETIEKQTYRGETLLASTVVTPEAAWENIYMVEVVRSCPELCRFCLASYLTLPFRTANLNTGLIPAIARGLETTNRLGLLGASVTQHPQFNELLDYLSQPEYDGTRVSIASVRTNTVTEKLAKFLTARETRSITIAIESGSEKIRSIVNKKLAQDEIITAAVNAKAGGLKGIKFYGMVGIPGEDEEDIYPTVELMQEIKKAARGLRLTLGCSTFVPKAHTPFQWYGVNPQGKKRLKILQKELGKIGIEFRPESYNWSVIQALISRGDRRLSHLLEFIQDGGETLGTYRRGFKELKGKLPSLDYYVHEEWAIEQILPWQHLRGPLPKETLNKHRNRPSQIRDDRQWIVS